MSAPNPQTHPTYNDPIPTYFRMPLTDLLGMATRHMLLHSMLDETVCLACGSMPVPCDAKQLAMALFATVERCRQLSEGAA